MILFATSKHFNLHRPAHPSLRFLPISPSFLTNYQMLVFFIEYLVNLWPVRFNMMVFNQIWEKRPLCFFSPIVHYQRDIGPRGWVLFYLMWNNLMKTQLQNLDQTSSLIEACQQLGHQLVPSIFHSGLIREEINRKKTFSFGHCPNYLTPWPQFGQLGHLFSDVTIQDLKVNVQRGGKHINNLKNS